ncbi:TetR/AcrR family transcriptional regulator [Arcanobacterium sp. S3PF19]|uniref:TetR/AcrR family transcriptional regulator n=1 Tax=Arcanobacterium sp. S3PF19 TaxID=1219585 RepID=UPI0009FE29B5|nr:TetR/AcrR family transcriptional regulator [Arcanobacterium sp. S3PF19]
MVRNKRLSFDERKQQIKRAAARIFTEKGFENTAMEDLVKETGLSKGGLYHYYKNTTGILYDIMLDGIAYRNNVIAQSIADGRQWSMEFLAEEMAKKAVDTNELMPVYVELLLAKKRNSRLDEVYKQLERTTLEMFKTQNIETETLNIAPNRVAFMAFFINAIILSANVLKAHELVQDNQDLIKDIILRILAQSDSENSTSQAERMDAPQPHNPCAEESKPHVPQPHPQQPRQRKQHHATPSPSAKERL